ncbi:Uncharacterised protein [Mycobacteroides abscessus subsp. massiliense]|nr:Uncharacterised protein [Mycobacteroides abscessus subsp. massiliense]
MGYYTGKEYADKAATYAQESRVASGEDKITRLALAVEALSLAVSEIAGNLHRDN